MRKIGAGGQLSSVERETMMGLIARKLSTSEIRALIGCNKQTVSDWRRRYRQQMGPDAELASRNSIARPPVLQLCLVNECLEQAVIGKYCAAHALTCGQKGRESSIAMSRLMGGRA